MEKLKLKLISNEELYQREGIPEEHSDVFLNIAKETNCVIMTRTPGKACGQLLDQGYDAKGFWIKSKSCDWGPMAGFVCLDPIFNKAKEEGALSNICYSSEALVGINQKKTFEDGKLAGVSQILINDQRISWLQKSDVLKPGSLVPIKEGSNIVGYSFKDNNVKVLLKKETLKFKEVYRDSILIPNARILQADKANKQDVGGVVIGNQEIVDLVANKITIKLVDHTFWALYYDHSTLYKYPSTSDPFPVLKKYYNDLAKTTCERKIKKLESNAEKSKKTENLKVQLKIDEGKIEAYLDFLKVGKYLSADPDLLSFAKGEFKHYRPLYALTNPHVSYSEETHNASLTHLNAITGDYDLYAVWPKEETEDDHRVAGMTADIKDKEELIKREGDHAFGRYVGNISPRIYLIAQLLNSGLMTKTGKPVNRVFHSDEVGRPFLNEVDSAVGFTPEGKIFFVSDAEELSTAIELLGYKYKDAEKKEIIIENDPIDLKKIPPRYHCFINKGWEPLLTENAKLRGKWSATLPPSPKK